MATVIINANDEELDPMRATGENVCGKSCSPLDGHRLLTTEFKQGDLSGKSSGQRLCVTNQTGRGKSKVITNFEQLLDAFVRNKMAHCCPVICSNDDTSFERDSYSTCSGF